MSDVLVTVTESPAESLPGDGAVRGRVVWTDSKCRVRCWNYLTRGAEEAVSQCRRQNATLQLQDMLTNCEIRHYEYRCKLRCRMAKLAVMLLFLACLHIRHQLKLIANSKHRTQRMIILPLKTTKTHGDVSTRVRLYVQ